MSVKLVSVLLGAGFPAAIQRKVMASARVTLSSGEKVVSVVPAVIRGFEL